MIGIDSVEGFPNVDGYHCVITIKDHASKLMMVEPTKSKRAEEAAWICIYGPPKKLMSDQGKQFVNDVIPFVVLAYNNKINTITKFAPYVVVFGRLPNKFEDWQSVPGEDEPSALVARSMEIRNMRENIRPQALKNIEKA